MPVAQSLQAMKKGMVIVMKDRLRSIENNEINIDIFDIFRDVSRDIWLIILFGISVAVCAYMTAELAYTPSYKTSATFVVTSKGYNDIYTNLVAANTVAETMTSIFSSDILENKVAKDIGMKKLPGTIKAEVINETNLFELTVTASTPKMAFLIITSIMNNYTSVTGDVFGNAILDVLEAPEFPMRPNNSLNIKIITEMAFLMGVVAMAAVLVIISVTRDVIKSEEELIKKLDTKLFGVVYHEKKYKTLRAGIIRKKKSILITSPTVSFSFVESIKKMRAKLEYKTSRNDSKVLLITSVRENEGKSTIATNLALSLAQKSFKVLLIDADFYNPSIYKILQKDIKKEEEISESFLKQKELKSALVYDEKSRLHLLLGRKLFKSATDLLAEEAFQKLIYKAKMGMDYIIIDAPPITESADAEILADISDVSLLVVRQSTAMTKDINDAIDLLTTSNSELLGCIYNNVHKDLLGFRAGYGSRYSYNNYYGYYKKKTSSPENAGQ